MKQVTVAALMLCVVLSACSTLPEKTTSSTVRNSLFEAKLASLSVSGRWSLTGRLAVNNGEDGGSGHLNWREEGKTSSMSFHGALGRGAWQISATDEGAVLEMSDGDIYQADSISELIDQKIGWGIPIDELAWWARGLTAPGDWVQRELDEDGNLLKLIQLGWEIDYGRYREVSGIPMPMKMTARHSPYTVKLAVQRWAILPELDLDE